MDANFEVSFRHFEATDHIRARIDELIGELEKLGDNLVSGRVVVDGRNRHGKKTVVSTTVELSHPGGIAGGAAARFQTPRASRPSTRR